MTTEHTESCSKSIILPPGLEFFTRKDWGADEPVDPIDPLRTPITHVRLTHSGGKTCKDRDACLKMVKKVQFDHMYHHGLPDVTFNFMIDPYGRVFEGRGWHLQSKRAEKYDDLKEVCIDIAFLGRYKKKLPPLASVQAAEALLKYGIEAGLVYEHYNLIGYKNELEDENNEESNNGN